jgi:hypothetical protein
MASIDSIDFYMGLSSAKSGFNIVCDVYALGNYANDPDVGSLLGTKSQDVSVIPLISGPGANWVTWTFDSPISVSDNDFAGVVLRSTGSAFNSVPIRHYDAQDYDYYTSGAKDGKERCYLNPSGSWVSQGSGRCLCYRLNGTGITQNVADNPDTTYSTLNVQSGFRAYVDGAGAPAKATNPDPANSATGVSTNLSGLSWTKGVGATYENVYFGPSGNMSQVEILNTSESFDLSSFLPLTYGATYDWRIDSVNDQGTTTGDVWSFTVLVLNVPAPTTMKQIKRLIACAENRFWYEDI